MTDSQLLAAYTAETEHVLHQIDPGLDALNMIQTYFMSMPSGTLDPLLNQSVIYTALEMLGYKDDQVDSVWETKYPHLTEDDHHVCVQPQHDVLAQSCDHLWAPLDPYKLVPITCVDK